MDNWGVGARYPGGMGELGPPRRPASETAAGRRTHGPVRMLGVATVGLLVVSILSFPSLGGAGPVPAPSLQAAVLTADGTDGYALRAQGGEVTVSAPAENLGTNLRVVFWSSDIPSSADATTCATWARASSDAVQQGAALRISTEPGGRVRAITVTKNVALGAPWVFNVHVWDSALGELLPVGQADLGAVFAAPGETRFPRPLPWRICARTEGTAVRFKVWRLVESEPAWGDASHGAVVTLPDDAPRSGVFGAFVGHLHPGMTTAFTDLTDGSAPPPAAFVPADDPTADLAGPAR